MRFCMDSALRGAMAAFLIVSAWCWFLRDQSGELWCMVAILMAVMRVVWTYLEERRTG